MVSSQIQSLFMCSSCYSKNKKIYLMQFMKQQVYFVSFSGTSTIKSLSCLLNLIELQLINIKNNIIKSNEDVKKEFESNEHIFKIIWTSVILKNVKETDVTNFGKLFEQELKYEIICDQSPKMTKQDVQSLLARVVANYEFHKNTHKYDDINEALIAGENGLKQLLITVKVKTIQKINKLSYVKDNFIKI
ncbi:hypothetical protein RFI_28337 [Reticulomyxa filosa]|uniref:Uncharacterized protein n=1 Tax=Reticulomyxa filosa TaxID=46433 RepID=X6M7P1_RETFI|nr:hypothetical protein RFI_28337 [Reticulomyxa filosa]|eukprot:ETO09050.1 hypothetical protein RFI_28337 [Reticulomyxa filosa]